MKKTKYIFLIIIAIVILGACGCSDVVIDGEITSDHEAILLYNITVWEPIRYGDAGDPVVTFFYDADDHWEQAGYTVSMESHESEENTTIIEIKKSVQCASREEAFEQLFAMLSDDISVFDEISYGYNTSFYLDDYYINGKIDMSKIVNESVYTEYPQGAIDNIDWSLENTTCSLRMTLPHNTGPDDTTNQYTFSYDIPIDAPTDINISGEFHKADNYALEREYKLALIIISIVLLVLIVICVLLIAHLRRLYRSKKALQEQANADTPVPQDSQSPSDTTEL